MISKKSKYALKALSYMAQHNDNQPILIAGLAEVENIPKKFLEFILLTLKKGGVLSSRVGKGGGYSLARHPSQITIDSVVRILDGGITLVHCLKDNNNSLCEEGHDSSCCGIHLVMQDLKNSIQSVLENTTLADMIEKSQRESLRKANIIDYAI